jgi:hypothetical protein
MPVRLTVFETASGPGLGAALAAAGLEFARVELSEGDEALVAGLRAADEALSGSQADVALVAGEGDGALAAVLTAVKLRVPTAWIAENDTGEPPLPGLLADVSLGANSDASEIAAAVGRLAAPTIAAP